MHTTTLHRRTLAGAAVLIAACFTLAVPTAHAGPKPEPQPAGIAGCPDELKAFAAQLRADGLTAQAANNAAHLTFRNC